MKLWGRGMDMMTKKMGTTVVPWCGAGSRERPCRWQGYSKREPQGMTQGLGEAGEEVTSVGREKRLPTETEAWVCFLAISVSSMSNVCAQHHTRSGGRNPVRLSPRKVPIFKLPMDVQRSLGSLLLDLVFGGTGGPQYDHPELLLLRQGQDSLSFQEPYET